MNIKCPHCGTEYEAEKQDMYRYTQCEVCGKGFVVGAENGSANSTRSRKTGAMNEMQKNRGAGLTMVNSTAFPHGTRMQSVWRSPSMAFTRWSFDGRALRSEYWPTILILGTVFGLCLLPFIWVIFDVIDSKVGIALSTILAVAGGAFCLFAQLPVTVRRLHDINLSGWWLLLFRLGEAIPYIGFCVSIAEFIVIGCLDGTAGANKYGSDPKGRTTTAPQQHVQGFTSQRSVPRRPISQHVVVSQTQTNTNVDDIGAKIKKLAELKNLGLLTEEEYKTKKEQLLKDF